MGDRREEYLPLSLALYMMTKHCGPCSSGWISPSPPTNQSFTIGHPLRWPNRTTRDGLDHQHGAQPFLACFLNSARAALFTARICFWNVHKYLGEGGGRKREIFDNRNVDRVRLWKALVQDEGFRSNSRIHRLAPHGTTPHL